jgi:hypothetical protein
MEEVHNLYSSRSFIRVVRSRRVRWVERVEGMGDTSNV